MPGGLRKEMLTWEPVRMVNMKLQPHEIMTTGQDQLHQPAALEILELSNLDQIFDHYNSVALFYDVASNTAANAGRKNCNGRQIVQTLEGALEELLLHYPAAAGRLRISDTNGRLEVEYCNSAPSACHHAYGVPFAVAHANIALCELGDVSAPHPSLDLLYPGLSNQSQDSSGKYLPRPVLAFQVTTFTCGGFVLAHVGHHAFMDGHAAAILLQNLGSIAKGAGLTVHPETLSRREVMKPTIPAPPNVSHIPTRASANIQLPYGDATRFAFSTAALETLRQQASDYGQAKQCSRYVALAALLWIARAKSRVMSSTPRPPPGQELLLRIVVSMKEKGVPGLTRGYVGNAVFLYILNGTLQELCDSPLPYVASKIQSALAGMDMVQCAQSQTDFIESEMRAGLVPAQDALVPVQDESNIIGIPSLVSLPFYDTDCGWGRPIYCGRPSRQLATRLIILDHPAAGAWNVLTVFNSQEERASFQEAIAEYISSSTSL